MKRRVVVTAGNRDRTVEATVEISALVTGGSRLARWELERVVGELKDGLMRLTVGLPHVNVYLHEVKVK